MDQTYALVFEIRLENQEQYQAGRSIERKCSSTSKIRGEMTELSRQKCTSVDDWIVNVEYNVRPRAPTIIYRPSRVDSLSVQFVDKQEE